MSADKVDLLILDIMLPDEASRERISVDTIETAA